MRQKTRYILAVLSFCILFGLIQVPTVHASFLGIPTLSELMAGIGNAILALFGSLVHLGGFLLDSAIEWTVVNMHKFVSDISTIDLAWRVFRDIANITFIFILLYAAIATILQVANFQTKQVVIRLVIVALLVNFSLFFTKAIVDVSNIAALQFYDAMVIENPQDATDKKGIADALMANMRLTSIYSQEHGVMNPDNTFSITIIGSIFFLIAAFVFLAGATLFIIRFAILILLMVVAPFAFVAMILPSTKQYWETWKNTLLKQAVFAPIYLALTYLVVRIVNDPNFKSALYSGGSSLADEIGGTASFVAGGASVTLAFGLVATLLISTLIISQKMSLAGAGTINKWGQSAQKWGRSKVQRGAGRVAGTSVGLLGRKADEGLGRTLIGNTLIGDKLRNITTRKAMNAKLGAGSKYIDRREKAVKAKGVRADARADVVKDRMKDREDKVAEQYEGTFGKIQEQTTKDILELREQREKLKNAGTPEDSEVMKTIDKKIVEIEQKRDSQLTEMRSARDIEMNEAAEKYLEEYEKTWATYPITGKRVFKGNKMTADKVREYLYTADSPDPDAKPWEAENKEKTFKDWKSRRQLRRDNKKKGKESTETNKQLLETLKELLEQNK